jgi:hypothetical protein
MKRDWEAKPFIDEMLYVVDGQLLNHILKICKKFGSIVPEYEKVSKYMIKSIIQCSNYPTGEITGTDEIDFEASEFSEASWDEIAFEEFLWREGIRLPNPNDIDNPYPDEEG